MSALKMLTPGFIGRQGWRSGVATCFALVLALGVRPVAAQMSVHGAFDVGDDGSAQYSIAIPAPPGVAGLQPHLSLTYVSTGDNGLVGMGWAISGLSSVARCPQTWAQDGLSASGHAPGGIHFDANDRFCLDGQRLFPVTPATSGQGGTEYRTEIDGFSRIIGFGSDPTNPTYFQVESKSGLISTYGLTTGATSSNFPTYPGQSTTREWALDTVRDRFYANGHPERGHSMSIYYINSSASGSSNLGDFRPSYIEYRWPSDGVSVGAKVVFNYVGRPDVTFNYVWGSLTSNCCLISEIDTELELTNGSTQPVTQYHMTYAAAPTGSLSTTLQTSLLSQIQVCAGATPDCATMPPVQFTYTTGTVDSNPGGTMDLQQADSGTEINWTDAVYPGDFFGDGIDSLLVTDNPNCASAGGCWTGWRLFRNTGSGYTLVASDPNGPGFGYNIYVADLLGTGKAGFVATHIAWSQGAECTGDQCSNLTYDVPTLTNTYDIYLPSGSGFQHVATGTAFGANERVFVGNFMGSGQMGLLVTGTPVSQLSCISQQLVFTGVNQGGACYHSSGWALYQYSAGAQNLVRVAGNSSTVSNPSTTLAGPDAEDRILAATYAGDGTTQILTICDPCGYGTTYTAISNLNTSDTTLPVTTNYTGEGQVASQYAILAGTAWTGWRMYSFDGQNMNLVNAGSFPNKSADVYVGNFGGDGKASLFAVPHFVNKNNTAGWTGWRLLRSMGNGFTQTGSGTNGVFGGDRLFVADLNGDGRDGVMVLGDPNNQNYPDTGWTLLQSDGFNMLSAASGSFPSDTETLTVGSYFRQSGSGVIVQAAYPTMWPPTTTPWSGWKLYNSNWQQPRFMLTGINNGVVNTTATYQALNTPGVHTPGTGAVYPLVNINPSLPVVTGISADDGVGGQRTNSYTYAGLVADQTGRGLLGFASTTSVQNEAGATVVKTFSQTFPYSGTVTNLAGYITPPGSGRMQTSSATMTYGCETSTTSSYSGGCAAPAPGLHYFVYKAIATTQVWDLNGAAFQPQTATSTYGDNWGNETQTQTATGDGYTETITRLFNNDVTDWLLGRLAQSSDQRTSP